MFGAEENWYALRTYFSQEQKVGTHLKDYSLTWFIPMRFGEKKTNHEKADGPLPHNFSKPFVHNLIFIKQPDDIGLLKRALSECPYSTSVYCKPDSREWCVIPGRDILELRIICDQSFTEPVFISSQQDELRKGQEVQVVHGPLSGVHGRLLRKNKKYYVIKSVTCGLSVMVAVSRWCCKPVNAILESTN